METIITSLKDKPKPRTIPLNVYADERGYSLCLDEMQSPVPLWNASLVFKSDGKSVVARGYGRNRQDAVDELCDRLNVDIKANNPSDFIIVKYPGGRFLFNSSEFFWIVVFRVLTFALVFWFIIFIISGIT